MRKKIIFGMVLVFSVCLSLSSVSGIYMEKEEKII